MKNFSTLIAGIFCSAIISAQPIQNSSFESWSIQNLFNEPNGFLSSNMWTYMSTGSGNVKKVSDSNHGMFAAKLETVVSGNDTMQGMLLIGTPGNQTINGGMPYSDTPDSVSGYIKRNIQLNDTANFIVMFKKSGTIIGMAQAQFAGTTVNYVRFSIPVSYFGMPPFQVDTIAVIISSSRMDPPQFPGSTITIDSISFIGATQLFPNGDFESWTAANIEDPSNWTTLNFASISSGQYSVTKSTDSYDGVYSARLESILTPWGDSICFITNGKFGNDGPYGGMPVSANPQKITGYYKYFPNGPDTALAGLWTYKFNPGTNSAEMLDSNVIHLTATNTYTYFEIPLAYNSNPVADTMNITFTACNMEDSASYRGIGSVLFIDKLDISYYPPLGTENIPSENSEFNLYPNPNGGKFNVIISQFDNLTIEKINIYNVMGEVLYSATLPTAATCYQLNLPNGIYFYQISNKKNQLFTGKLVIEK